MLTILSRSFNIHAATENGTVPVVMQRHTRSSYVQRVVSTRHRACRQALTTRSISHRTYQSKTHGKHLFASSGTGIEVHTGRYISPRLFRVASTSDSRLNYGQKRSLTSAAFVKPDSELDNTSQSTPTDMLGPYTAESKLALEYVPEYSVSGLEVIEVNVIKVFTPFTNSQSLVVELSRPHHHLPRRFVVKLVDPRFCRPEHHHDTYKEPWNLAYETRFGEGILNARRGLWPNYSVRLGSSNPIKVYDTDYLNLPQPQQDWVQEFESWDGLFDQLDTEIEAYRLLRSMQGAGIPRLYGTCRYYVKHVGPILDPMLATVPGILLEYIEGTSMDRLKVSVDLSEADAERVSQGVLNLMRRLRRLRVIHNDIAGRNFIVRPKHLDYPFLIDFGMAMLPTRSSSTEEEWNSAVASNVEVDVTRRALAHLDWHTPSPSRRLFEQPDPWKGWRYANVYARAWRDMRPTRFPPETLFEEINDRPPDVVTVEQNGKQHVWEQLRYRMRPGINTNDADLDWKDSNDQ